MIYSLLVLALFSILAFWKENHVLFMVTAGAFMMVGLYAPDFIRGDEQTTNLGISMGLLLMIGSLVCIAMAFRLLWRQRRQDAG